MVLDFLGHDLETAHIPIFGFGKGFFNAHNILDAAALATNHVMVGFQVGVIPCDLIIGGYPADEALEMKHVQNFVDRGQGNGGRCLTNFYKHFLGAGVGFRIDQHGKHRDTLGGHFEPRTSTDYREMFDSFLNMGYRRHEASDFAKSRLEKVVSIPKKCTLYVYGKFITPL